MPKLSEFYGIIIYMFFSDHTPPHFHANYQGYDMLVEIMSGQTKGDFPKRGRSMVLSWLKQNKPAIVESWNLLQEEGKIRKVKPLA